MDKIRKLILPITEFIASPNVIDYDINGVDEERAIFFYRVAQQQFAELHRGDYTLVNESNNQILRITNAELLATIEKFQVCYVFDFSSSDYKPEFGADVNVLKDRYNELYEDVKMLFKYVKESMMVADGEDVTTVLPQLDTDEVWVKTDTGYRGFKVGDIEANISEFWKQFAEAGKKIIAQITQKGNEQIEVLENFTQEKIKEINEEGLKLKITQSQHGFLFTPVQFDRTLSQYKVASKENPADGMAIKIDADNFYFVSNGIIEIPSEARDNGGAEYNIDEYYFLDDNGCTPIKPKDIFQALFCVVNKKDVKSALIEIGDPINLMPTILNEELDSLGLATTNQVVLSEPTIEKLRLSTKYKSGDVVEVLGYYQKGDGAGHKRIIDQANDGSGIELSNGLFANIIHNGEINASWLGITNIKDVKKIGVDTLVVDIELIHDSDKILNEVKFLKFKNGIIKFNDITKQLIIDCDIIAKHTDKIFDIDIVFTDIPEKKCPIKFKKIQDVYLDWFGATPYKNYTELTNSCNFCDKYVEIAWRSLIGDYVENTIENYTRMEYERTGNLIIGSGLYPIDNEIILGRRSTKDDIFLWGSCNIIGQGEGQTYFVATDPTKRNIPLIINGKALEYSVIRDIKITYANYRYNNLPTFTSSAHLAGIALVYCGSLRLENMWNSGFHQGSQILSFHSDNVTVKNIQTEYNKYEYQFVNTNDFSLESHKGFLPLKSTFKFGCNEEVKNFILQKTGMAYMPRKNKINAENIILRGQGENVSFIDIENQEVYLNLSNAIINHSYGNVSEIKLSEDFVISKGECSLTLNANNIEATNFRYFCREYYNFSKGGSLNLNNISVINDRLGTTAGAFGFITGTLKSHIVNGYFEKSNAIPIVNFSNEVILDNVTFKDVNIDGKFIYTSNGKNYFNNIKFNNPILGQVNSGSLISFTNCDEVDGKIYTTEGVTSIVRKANFTTL